MHFFALKHLGIAWSAAVLATVTPALAQGLFINGLEERGLGVRGHAEAIKEHGGEYRDPALAAYISDLGMRAARVSAHYPEQFVFTVVDDSNFNAFTRMGGFIYIQTGVLPWINDEFEMAALIGHEVGHAIGRHSAHEINRRKVADIVIGMSAMRGRGASTISDKKLRASLFMFEYGRDQEYESDDVAFSAVSKMGLDPYGASRMLNALVLRSNLDRKVYGPEIKETPEAFRSHPASTDRVRRSLGLAEKSAVRPDAAPRNRDQYLDMLDGLRLKPDSMTLGRPSRVRVVRVRAGETANVLAQQMLTAPAYKLDMFLAMNGLSDASQIKAGDRVKLLVAAS